MTDAAARPAPRSSAGVVASCRGVHKRFGQGASAVTALAGVDLDLGVGQVAALTGPSGSGKSTLLHLFGAMDEPTQGTVHVAGRDLAGLDDEAASAFRNRHLGFIFQFFHLVPALTVLDNIALPARLGGAAADVARAAAEALARRVGISELIGRRPDELSGGQRQRVAVARALVNDPDLVLADEPTGNLDHVTGGEVIELLVGLGHERGVAVVVATHDPAVTAAADLELRLDDGRLVTGNRAAGPS